VASTPHSATSPLAETRPLWEIKPHAATTLLSGAAARLAPVPPSETIATLEISTHAGITFKWEVAALSARDRAWVTTAILEIPLPAAITLRLATVARLDLTQRFPPDAMLAVAALCHQGALLVIAPASVLDAQSEGLAISVIRARGRTPALARMSRLAMTQPSERPVKSKTIALLAPESLLETT